MYAIEFEAPIENGIVHIPKKYHNLQQISKAKFFVVYDIDNKKNNVDNLSVDDVFDKFQIDMSNFIFDREEAHER